MRVYIIGNDGITLCRKAPATVNDGEIAVGSNEELHAEVRTVPFDFDLPIGPPFAPSPEVAQSRP